MAKNRKKKRPAWLQHVQQGALIRVATIYLWILRLTCRIKVVDGADHVDEAAASGVVVPCCWHQQITSSALFLRGLTSRGLKIGFLISPSREGEFISRVALNHGVEVMRGSSSRTGSDALKAIVKGTKNGISPTMYADGPRGPARVMKPGTVILAQRTGTPILPVGSVASRYWQVGSWDKHRIPKPFSRIYIAAGALWRIDRNATNIDELAQQVGHAIDELTTTAEAARSQLH